MKKNSKKELMIGAVAGSVLGAVTALLFAPKTGKELRSDLADGAKRATEKTQEAALHAAEKSKELVATISSATQEAAETVGRQTSEIASRVKNVKEQLGQVDWTGQPKVVTHSVSEAVEGKEDTAQKVEEEARQEESYVI